jgi:uncharacterized protein YabN with tetrapyrrole methylase and pyrophosphatase domain
MWENAKKKERGEQTALERVLDVPPSLPGLMRAQKSIRREWQAKNESHPLEEVLAGVRSAADALCREGAGEKELGEALEALCAAAHAMDLDAETALRAALGRRIERLKNEG